MVDQAQLALINAEIDGELDERQRAELSRCLLADPGLRTVREQMRRVCAALDATPAVDPPAQLRTDILAALPHISPRRTHRELSWKSWRYAAVLAGVLLTGTVVFRVMDFGQKPAANEMAGTLAAARTAATLDVVQLAQGAVSGQISLVRNGTELGVSFDLAASAPVDVVIAGEGRKVQVSGLGPHGKYGPGPTTIPLPGFEGRGQAVQLTFLIGGREVARSVLREPTAP